MAAERSRTRTSQAAPVGSDCFWVPRRVGSWDVAFGPKRTWRPNDSPCPPAINSLPKGLAGAARTVEERTERRLEAILAADVAGYSRLMGTDEEGTHQNLKDHCYKLVEPKIAQHRGRIIKNTGDGFLAEFMSVLDAVRCAAEIQKGMVERNTDVSHDKRIEFRMGIHQGDVIIDSGDIFGDGVNRSIWL
jgi:class 3 adenylate cyclase